MTKLFFASLALLILPIGVLAATVNLENPLPINSLFQSSSYIGSVISRGLAIIGSVALLMLIYGGLTMIMAAGSEKQIAQGKQIVTYTAIGLVVIFISYTVITFFVKTLGGQIKYEYNDLPTVATTTGSNDILPGDTPTFPREETCPAGCVKTDPCIGINQPTECINYTGCCAQPSE